MKIPEADLDLIMIQDLKFWLMGRFTGSSINDNSTGQRWFPIKLLDGSDLLYINEILDRYKGTVDQISLQLKTKIGLFIYWTDSDPDLYNSTIFGATSKYKT